MSDQVKSDLDVLEQVFGNEGWPPNEGWYDSPITLHNEQLHGVEALEALLSAEDPQLGWIVQTGQVLAWQNDAWRTRRGKCCKTPWHNLLSAELAFADKRGVRLTLLRDRIWSCQEVREGVGNKHCLVSKVTHQAVWGAPGFELHYRVYWHPEPTLPGTDGPECYQPIAWRWAAEDTQ